ncbi:cupredoxin domain-containing protein [Paenibacillus sp. GSMTC-2017]|uniref:cupredoxin domain-containing protein n=1 Tax=Paenibacillus sp. GSMTC-2017 TaxID=2794350 RepID=UPI0018D718D0|nr:cupredoxin domain-containing protein [Paenibacillus sp. GSMTC-2017]
MKKWLAFASILGLALVIAACGANGKESNTAGNGAGNKEAVETGSESTSEVVITASDWEFDQQEYKIKAGENVDLTLKSVGSIHGVSILKSDYSIKNNKTISVKFDEPGTYDMICSIPCGAGHRLMKAKLIVE